MVSMSWQTEVADFWAEENRLFDEVDKIEYFKDASDRVLTDWIKNYYHPYGWGGTRSAEIAESVDLADRDALMPLFQWSFDGSTGLTSKQRNAAARVMARICTMRNMVLEYPESRTQEAERIAREREERQRRRDAWSDFFEPVMGGSDRIREQGMNRPARRAANAAIQGANPCADMYFDTESSSVVETARRMGIGIDMSRVEEHIASLRPHTYAELDAMLTRDMFTIMGTRTGRVNASRPNTELVRRHRNYIRTHDGYEYPAETIRVTRTMLETVDAVEYVLQCGSGRNRRYYTTRIDPLTEQEFHRNRSSQDLHNFLMRELGAEIISRGDSSEEISFIIHNESTHERVVRERQERGQQRMGFPTYQREHQRR
jgi:hypothetical protein